MSFAGHWYFILFTSCHKRRADGNKLASPEVLQQGGIVDGGQITVTYQSLNHPLTKEVARIMFDHVMRNISHSTIYTDAPDPTCSVVAMNNPNEKKRHIELTGKQEDSVSCGMYIGDAVRQIYAIK